MEENFFVGQREIFDLIKKRGTITVPELAKEFHCTKSKVSYKVHRLKKSGLVLLERNVVSLRY